MRLAKLHEFAFIWFELKKFLISNYLDKAYSGWYTAQGTGAIPTILFLFFHHCQKQTGAVMSSDKNTINTFLVEIFHDVLRLEGDNLRESGCEDLSSSEIHLLEAAAQGGEGCTMGQLAARLSLSASSVTIAVSALERKGYLERNRSAEDRRRVIVTLTPKALEALVRHRRFHEKLVDSITEQLDEHELDTLASALSILHHFFRTL
jgi:DNA-binding MarR family transcriptional regulator